MDKVFADYVFPILEPHGWPLWVRRAFLLTLPVSGPVWFLLCVALLVGVLVCFAVLMAGAAAKEWFAEVGAGVRSLWSESSR